MQRRTLLKSAVLPTVTVSAGMKAQAAPDGTAPEEIAVDVAIAGGTGSVGFVLVTKGEPRPERKVKEESREPEDEKEKPCAEQKERSRKAARSGHCMGSFLGLRRSGKRVGNQRKNRSFREAPGS